MKILSVIGARPQFIKAAMVSRRLAEFDIDEKLIHTGQHFDPEMSAIFFKQLALPEPSHYLGIGGLSHGAMTGRMLEALESIFQAEKPDWVLVYGDTNSTLAGALAAAKLHIPIAHVEAGMRSFNRQMPEELNRVMVDHLSSLLLVTSQEPIRLLANEGIQQGVHCVGDVMYDAVQAFIPAASRTLTRSRFGLDNRPFGIITLHRAENTDQPQQLKIWLEQFQSLSKELPLVFPVHPRTRAAIQAIVPDWSPPGLIQTDPLGYLELLDLQRQASLVLTDSGGMQKEAFYLGVPCLTLRTETEWTETVTSGRNRLLGEAPQELLAAARNCLENPPSGPVPTIYGDGQAALHIARLLSGLNA